MRYSVLIISILLFGSIVTGFYAFTNSLAGGDAYNIQVTDYSSSFDKTSNISDEISGKYNDLVNWSAKKSSATQIITLVPDSLSLIKSILFLPLNMLTSIVSSLSTFLQLPAWVTSLGLTVLVIGLIFGLIALILRYKET